MISVDSIVLFLEQHSYLTFFCLLLLAMLTEDIPIVAAAVLYIKGIASIPFLFLSLILGILAGHGFFYWLGYNIHRIKWAHEYMNKKGMYKATEWLDKHIILAVIASRLLPGVRYAVYGALGFCRIPIRHFAVVTLVAVTAFVSIYFSLAAQFGMNLTNGFMNRDWLIIVGLLATLILAYKVVRARFDKVANQSSPKGKKPSKVKK